MSGRITHRVAHAGISARTEIPPLVIRLDKNILNHCFVAGDQPYRHICSIGKDAANINAPINHTMIVQRIDQNSRAMGV